MVDYTMCTNIDCEIKYMCYRARAVPDELHQSYEKFQPETNEYGHYVCLFFKPIFDAIDAKKRS